MSLKVSIITPTYNSAATLMDCIASVVQQDYTNVEYVIIDGNSKDNTKALIANAMEQYPQIKYLSESDFGVYDALNKGISMVTGDIIGFVHSDDFLANPKVITTIVEAFSTTNCEAVYGDLEYVNKKHTLKVIRYWKSCNFNSKFLRRGWMPPHPTLFLKKSVYDKNGIFNITYKIAADYDYVLRIFRDEQLVSCYLPIVMTKMRIGGISNRSLKNIILKSREDYKILKQNKFSSPLYTLLFKNLTKLKQFEKLSILFQK